MLVENIISSQIKPKYSLQHCFAVSFKREQNKQYEFRAFTEDECQNWIDHIRLARLGSLTTALKKKKLCVVFLQFH